MHVYKYKQVNYETLPRLKTSNVWQMDESNVEKGAMMFENHYGEGENKVEAQADHIETHKTVVNITDLQRAMPHLTEDGSKPDWRKNMPSLTG